VLKPVERMGGTCRILGLHIGHRRVHLRCTGIDWDGFTPFGKHDLVEIHVVEKRGEVERP